MKSLFFLRRSFLRTSFSRSFVRTLVMRSIAGMAVAVAVPAFSQVQLPCPTSTQDRTITYCYPIDDANVSASSVLNSGRIRDSLPHTSKMFLDGQLEATIPDTFSGATGFNFDDKIHTITIVVTDASGTFQRSASFRETLQPPCSVPTTDRSLNFCIPGSGAVTQSPVRVAAMARSSVGVSYLQVWADGVKFFTEHNAGTANLKMMNDHIYLTPGTHSVTMIAKEGDGTSIKKTVTIRVIPNP